MTTTPRLLKREINILRSTIRSLTDDQLSNGERLKALAEIRHQIETLCTALVTEHKLDQRDSSELDKLVAKALEELGDQMEAPR